MLSGVVLLLSAKVVVTPGLAEPGSWLAIVMGFAVICLLAMGWVKVLGW
jgi:hypothetical protein